jgi:hypothetical protein
MRLKDSARSIVEYYLGTDTYSDELIQETLVGLILESKLQKLIDHTKEVSVKHDPQAVGKSPKEVIMHLSQAHDPTTGKDHTEHILKWYNAGHVALKDGERVRGLIKRYERHKDELPFKVSDFDHPDKLQSAMESKIGKEFVPSYDPDMRSKDREAVEKGSKKIYDDDQFEVRTIQSSAKSTDFHEPKPKERMALMRWAPKFMNWFATQDPVSRKAVQVLGSKTTWCTTPERAVQGGVDYGPNPMFEHYSEFGPLYWVHRKSDNKRVMVHPQTGQSRQEDDGHFDIKELPKFLQGRYHEDQTKMLNDPKPLSMYHWHGLSDDRNMTPENMHKLIDRFNIDPHITDETDIESPDFHAEQIVTNFSRNPSLTDDHLHHLATKLPLPVKPSGVGVPPSEFSEYSRRKRKYEASYPKVKSFHQKILSHPNVGEKTRNYLAQHHAENE